MSSGRTPGVYKVDAARVTFNGVEIPVTHLSYGSRTFDDPGAPIAEYFFARRPDLRSRAERAIDRVHGLAPSVKVSL